VRTILPQALFAFAVVGCTTIPQGRSSVDAVKIAGNAGVPAHDLEDKIATVATPKFFGLFRGVVYEYAIYDRFVLEQDLRRIERFYQARGYYEAEVRCARTYTVSSGHVRVEIVVNEGEPVRVRSRELEGVPPALANELRNAVFRQLPEGAVFEEASLEASMKVVETHLANGGYAFAKVSREASIDVRGHTADVRFRVVAGPLARFGPVRIEGLGDIPEAPVRRAVRLRERAVYSRTAIETAQRAALDLGVFSAVDVTPQLSDPPPSNGVVPVLVRVHPTRLRTVSIGGGVELDAFKTDVHGRLAWQHKNAFGGLEKFDVSFKPGVVLYPTRLSDFRAPEKLLPEEKFFVQLRRPGLFEPRTSGFVAAQLDIYPAILSYQADPSQAVIGYVQSKATLGVDRRFFKVLFGSLSHVVQVSNPFAYLGTLATNPGAFVVSYPRLFVSLDLRDNIIEPHAGFYADAELQVAGFGGQPRDLRLQPEVRGYIPLGKVVTLALRSTIGLLFPGNYSATSGGVDSTTASARDQQIIYFRGFFSGGPASNRGYPLRGVGPQGTVRFLDAGISQRQLNQNCVDQTSGDASCQVPLGGVTLWEASAELRFPIASPLAGVLFCDASDVSEDVAMIRLDRPHFSCGLGLRYATPVGPVRLDSGFRIPGLQVLGEPDPPVYGALFSKFPMALQFGIGEVF
jgi:outer membrane protein insertion porin family/translocation and assembly module TamA